MSQQTNQNCCQKCCENHYPRCPYTHTEQAFDYCCIGCDKPGIGAQDHDPYNNSGSDCALLSLPCTLVADIVCCPFIMFGYYNVTNPN